MPALRFHPSLETMMVPADAVRPHPSNPNNGDVDEIVASVMVNGCYRPIIANQESGYILAGHHLYAALLQLGATRIPVLWLSTDDRESARILLADNRIAALARVDDGLLIDLLKYVDNDDVDGLAGTGYSVDDYLDLLAAQERGLYADQLDGYTPDMDARLAKYQQGGTRYVVVGYDGDIYAKVVDALAAARKERGHPDNATLLLDLLGL